MIRYCHSHPNLQYRLNSSTNPTQTLHSTSKMVKDEDLVELGHPEYWNTRYASEQTATEDGSKKTDSYEWFRTFEALQPFFTKRLPAPSNDLHVLQLGCGNSVCTYTYTQKPDFEHMTELSIDTYSRPSRTWLHESNKCRFLPSRY